MANAEYEINLIINSNYKFIDVGHDLVKTLCTFIGFDQDTTDDIILAVREGISNAIKLGNRCDLAKKVSVKMRYDSGELSITIEDEGEGFDDSKLEDPRTPENLLKATGRGIFFMKNLMDEVFFTHHGTVLHMKKFLQSTDEKTAAN
jgi:serine/threonine-protein kinase RsbW